MPLLTPARQNPRPFHFKIPSFFHSSLCPFIFLFFFPSRSPPKWVRFSNPKTLWRTLEIRSYIIFFFSMDDERALEKCPENTSPLFSIIVSFYCLILLYFPNLFLSFVFSPVLISTAILLVTLVRLGSAQQEKDVIFLPDIQKLDPKPKDSIRARSQQSKDVIVPTGVEENDGQDEVAKWVGYETGFHRNVDISDTFVEWNRSGPLEVIYEESDGEEDGDSPEYTPGMDHRHVGNDGSLYSDLYYSDSDSSEGEYQEEFPVWDSPENLCFRWEEKEGLIEISLQGKPTVRFEVEEENLIEINLSVGRK